MNPSFLKEVSAGYAGGTQIPLELLPLVAVVTEVAIAMVLLSPVLSWSVESSARRPPDGVSRSSVLAIALTTPGTVPARPGLAVIPRAIPTSPSSSPRSEQSGKRRRANKG
jgi:hypothetical protein